jgi:hypothetical protein
VTGGAAAAEPGAEPDQQACGHNGKKSRHHGRPQRISASAQRQRRGDQPGEKRDPPSAIAAGELAEDAGDPGDPAGQQHQQDGRKTDERAADCRGNGIEGSHHSLLHWISRAAILSR